MAILKTILIIILFITFFKFIFRLFFSVLSGENREKPGFHPFKGYKENVLFSHNKKAEKDISEEVKIIEEK